jgi:hypothetical protein
MLLQLIRVRRPRENFHSIVRLLLCDIQLAFYAD